MLLIDGAPEEKRGAQNAQLRDSLGAATISVNWIIKICVIGYIDMRFTLRQLQVFVAVAQHQSVSRAASLLSLSQSAASTSITEQEARLGCGPGSDRTSIR